MANHFVRLAFAALAASPAAATAQPVPAQLSASPPIAVNVRLSPDLGAALPAVKSALARISDTRVAEPADYVLTTKRDYPQTLIAVDADQTDYKGEYLYFDPLKTELGNLILDDYGPAFRTLVARTASAKSLLASAARARGRTDEIETCVRTYESAPLCNFMPSSPAKTMPVSPEEIPYDSSTVLIRNHTSGSRYVAVFLVDPGFGVQRLSLGGHEHGELVAAGASAETATMDVLGDPSGKYSIVTLWSEQPFNAEATAAGRSWAGVYASITAHRQMYLPPGELGGGDPVLDRMAPWMAEMYSTVPYTKEEKAADALKPADQQEHLGERTDEELAHRCGGSLIAPDLVVTAAHCVAIGKYEGAGMANVLKERRIRLGTKFLGDGGTTYAIAGVAVPADYSPQTKQNDIALLLLKADRDTAYFPVKTIAIGSRPLLAGTALTAYGWGYTGSVPQGRNPLFDMARELQHNPDFLRFGRLAVLNWNTCQKRVPLVAEGMVCMVAPDALNGGESAHNVFTCRGDSGGPLVRAARNKDELVGVTSWSMGCGYRDFPSVFTDVTKYRAWIASARQQLVPGAAIRVPQSAATVQGPPR